MNKMCFQIVARGLSMLFVSMALAGCLEESGGEGKQALVGSGSTSEPAPSPEVPVTNRAPEISGVPPGNAEVGKIYTFTPIASDADKDFLEFEITNKPVWAQFSVETGTLNGTPTAASVGPSQDITITV